jgi:hypothetical protein
MVSILFFGGNGKIIKPQICADFADTAGLLIRVRQTQSTFHPLAQRNAFRCRDVRQQSRSFAGLESIAETQPQLQPALLRLSAMDFPVPFHTARFCLFFASHSNSEMIGRAMNNERRQTWR